MEELFNCIICGREFIRHRKSHLCCSRKCRDKHTNLKKDKICPQCGKIFRSDGDGDFCSSECAEEHRKKELLTKKVCPNCGKEFEGYPF